MAVSIPESMSFGLLSRLPPQSFEYKMVEIRPDQAPVGGSYDMTSVNRPVLHIRGAPNEFILNTEINICGTLSTQCEISANLNGRLTVAQANAALADGTLPDYKYGNCMFRSSRESFNSQALPFLDNQENNRHIQINQYRGRCARRAISKDSMTIDGLESAGFVSTVAEYKTFNPQLEEVGNGPEYAPRMQLLTNVKQSAAGGAQAVSVLGDVWRFKVPLGFYSNLINCHSVIPQGLMSAYSVNGWSIELETELANADVGSRGFINYAVISGTEPAPSDAPKQITPTLASSRLYGLRIFVPVIKVLDPAVMEAVLSLYEKRETVTLGSVQFPMSLRLNTLGFRTFSYPINPQGQSDYYFRLPMTDKSVRGYMWALVARGNFFNRGVPISNNIVVTRLETKIGSLSVHDVVENQSPQEDNVNAFVYNNLRRSGYLWSPFPAYLENQQRAAAPEDKLISYRTGQLATANSFSEPAVPGNVPIVVRSTNTLCYGCVSFENLDHREPDYAGSYQASGYDTTNRGGIDVNMRLNSMVETIAPNLAGAAVASWSYVAPDVPGYGLEIIFQAVYDAIFEVSPVGVSDITNASL